MNLVLLESDEISGGVAEFGGARAEHVIKILHGAPGRTLKTGVVGGLAGVSLITGVEDGRVRVECRHTDETPRPWADVVLAPPRPRVMKRLLPQLAALGAARIVLVGAKKVEKDFWGATLLKEANYRPLLVDGMMQAGTTALPAVEARRNFVRFMKDEADSMFAGAVRVVAHP
ncbi:MAG: 16S rRNA (uracil(1498)-N(3))-methyltransferase, partial [Kiritimatiellae bacterium]|nr:16S rRNA (uracil(1498)-N(3))-methyltransferase [Kiritimatiellia bacterium]